MLLIGKFVLLAIFVNSSSAMMPPSATEYYAESLVDAHAAFSKWMKNNGKTYASDIEKSYRFLVWRKTLNDVVNWNTDSQVDFKYYKGMTWFADYTQEEFQAKTLCSFPSLNARDSSSENSIPLGASGEGGNSTATTATQRPPTSVDWRAAGVVGNIKNQQNCGSCWAHGPVSAVESAFALVPPISGPPDLSEQELIDCAPGSRNDNGCDGNNKFNAYNTIIRRGGISLEQDYSFVSGNSGIDGECLSTARELGRPYVSIDGFVYDESVDEEVILAWAAFHPVTVAVDATDWRLYRGGIFDGPCGSNISDVNHAVAIVGYGEEAGVPYWLVRNSWGKTWGEEGYMRLRRGVGRCAVGSQLSFPLYCGWNAICRQDSEQRDGTDPNSRSITTDGTPIRAIFPPRSHGTPLPIGSRGNIQEEKSEGSPGTVVLVEYGEFENGIIAAFDAEYGAYMPEQ